MEKELVLREPDVLLRGIYDALSAGLQGAFEEGNDVSGGCGQLVCQLLIVRDQVRDIDVTVVLLDQYILSYLISGETLAVSTARNRANRTCR